MNLTPKQRKILVVGLFLMALGCAKNSKPFVASAGRGPFHDRSCEWAGKINSSNLEQFATREDAIAAGHRPCKVCRP